MQAKVMPKSILTRTPLIPLKCALGLAHIWFEIGLSSFGLVYG